jgi:transcriptional regulator with XRE-family HTH domain
MIIIFIIIRRQVRMLTTGNQLKAARALAGIEQIELAELAGVAVTTIRKMEWQKAETLTSGLGTVKRVQSALELLGIEFQNHGQPGVRLMRAASKGEGA